MRPVGVVVVDVDAQDTLTLPAAADQQPVKAIAADGADPAFGECVRPRRAKRGADDLDALAAEDVVGQGKRNTSSRASDSSGSRRLTSVA